MRHTGTLRSWNAERGFGFIAPDQGGREIFVHISALPRDGTQPVVGEKISFEMAKSKDGKLQAVKANREAFGLQERHRKASDKRDRPVRLVRRSQSRIGGFAWFAVLLTIAGYRYSRYENRMPAQPLEAISSESLPQETPSTRPVPTFSCDGRTYCSQMSSCKEAKFFLKNCPGTKMDGNHDGVPCEQQWCTSPLAD